MEPAMTAPDGGARADQPQMPIPAWRTSFRLPVALTALFLCFIGLPEVHGNPRMLFTYLGVAGGLLAWQLVLWLNARAHGRTLLIEPVPPRRNHYIQATVHLMLTAYWGYYWREMYHQFPLILSQLVFCFVLDGLISWSRGHTWKLSFGPVPIVFSVNLFLWFRDDWFYLQFALMVTCFLAKHFIRWKKDGKWTHIFNPSAFGLTVASIILIATGTTGITWAEELATSLDAPPNIFIVIFCLGLIVQYFFQVTLMTFSAVAMLVVLNLIYTESTGYYYFINTSIPVAGFFGMHLLLTDPSTSPRTNIGRVAFGALYGVGYWVCFALLFRAEAPVLYAKLLVVPFLNVLIQGIDFVVNSGPLAALNRRWETALPKPRMNVIHIGVWAAFFITLVATGFLAGPHPGNSIPFWRKAYVEGVPDAPRKLIIATGAQAQLGSGLAYNELALLAIDGILEPGAERGRVNAIALNYFDASCRIGDPFGCLNLEVLHILLAAEVPDDLALYALGELEKITERPYHPEDLHRAMACYLIGAAYEGGRAYPQDDVRAIEYYKKAGPQYLYAVFGIARIAIKTGTGAEEARALALTLEQACQEGYTDACWYIAYMYNDGVGVSKNPQRARAVLTQACRRSMARACQAITDPQLPPYADPLPLIAPSWVRHYEPKLSAPGAPQQASAPTTDQPGGET